MLNKPKNRRLSSAVKLALGVATAASLQMPGAVWAQDSESGQLEEVIVTGSRIARDPENYLGGMAIVSGEDIEKIGSYSTIDLLRELPSVGLQGINRNDSNGGRGANLVDVHNLGVERTLVLLNGRRMVNTVVGGQSLGVDMQSFPVNMIQSVEVLGDGASAVYGSDAIAGVVNVMTRNDFEGFELTGGYGEPSDAGGESRNVGMLFGIQGSRGRMVAGGTFVETENVDFQDRKWSRVPILGQSDIGLGFPSSLIGSGIPPEGRVTLPSGRSIIFIPDAGTGASFQDYDTFGLSGLNGSSGDGSIQSILDTGHRFNYNDPGVDGVSLINGARVFNFGVIGEVDFDNGFTVYTDMLAQHREGRLNFTPLPVSGAAGRFTDLLQVPTDHPLLPDDARQVIIDDLTAEGAPTDVFQMAYRGLDLGNRRFDYDVDTQKYTVGFRGDLELADRSWSVDSWGTWGQSRLTEVTSGQLNVGHLQAATDPAQCAVDASCPKDGNGQVTFDPFGRGPKSQEEIDYILFDDHEKTEYEMWHVAATVSTNELFDLPAGGIGFAAGVEYREESGSVTPSGIVGDGNSGGNFAEPTKGDYDVWEIYAEANVPLLSGAPLAEELTLEGATRYTEYDDFDETTWKVGGRWTLNSMLSFRAQASTGFRAPNVLELFGGDSDTFIGVTDPCNVEPRGENATVDANCTALGVPANYVQPAAQLKVTQGGNPDLEPETSDNWSAGVVFTPDLFDGFRVALDWYDVQVEDAVSTPDPSSVINACYESTGLSDANCARLDRNPGGDFAITRFDLLNENIGKIDTSGLDINSTVSFDTSFGLVTVDWLANYLDEYKEVTDGVEDDRTGRVACETCNYSGYPEWRSNLSVSWARDSWDVTLTWRYIDGMDIDDQIGFDTVNTETDEVNYFDIYGSYTWDNFQISAGIDNLTDEEPEFLPAISTNTSTVYDWLGMFTYARLKVSF